MSRIGIDGFEQLVPGPVPNPWNFTTNSPPSVTFPAPAAGACWTGGSAHDIMWTMSDDVTPTAGLVVWINYTAGGPSVGVAVPLTGVSSFWWTVPAIDNLNVRVTVDVTDGVNDVGTATSGGSEVDSTAPTVVQTVPAPNALNVPTSSQIVITFSEAMARAATEGAITIAPSVTVTARQWSVGDTVLTISTSTLTAGRQYTVTIGTGALDACDPGSGLATAHQFSFRTATVRPSPPTGVTATATSPTTVSVSWTAPATYTDNSPLSSADIQGYFIERATSLSGLRTNLTSSGARPGTSLTDSGLTQGTTYYYWVKVVLLDGRVSDETSPAPVTTQAQAPDLTWLWILLIIIIVVVLIIALLAVRRRKKPEAMAQPSTPAEEPSVPTEETPAEGGTEESAGGAR